jgi:hypothetical protein
MRHQQAGLRIAGCSLADRFVQRRNPFLKPVQQPQQVLATLAIPALQRAMFRWPCDASRSTRQELIALILPQFFRGQMWETTNLNLQPAPA